MFFLYKIQLILSKSLNKTQVKFSYISKQQEHNQAAAVKPMQLMDIKLGAPIDKEGKKQEV